MDYKGKAMLQDSTGQIERASSINGYLERLNSKPFLSMHLV